MQFQLGFHGLPSLQASLAIPGGRTHADAADLTVRPGGLADHDVRRNVPALGHARLQRRRYEEAAPECGNEVSNRRPVDVRGA